MLDLAGIGKSSVGLANTLPAQFLFDFGAVFEAENDRSRFRDPLIRNMDMFFFGSPLLATFFGAELEVL